MAGDLCPSEPAASPDASSATRSGYWARVWKRHYPRVRGLARKLLQGRSRVADEDDVAAAAFARLLQRRPEPLPPGETTGVWPLLAAITRGKAFSALRREGRQRRGGGRVRGESAWSGEASQGGRGLDRVADPVAVSQEDSLARREQLRQLDPELQRIAVMRMQGYSNMEIAEAVGRSLPTIERRLRLLRTYLRRLES